VSFLEIRFKQYGLKSVEVVDNGCGIAEGDYDNIGIHARPVWPISLLTYVLSPQTPHIEAREFFGPLVDINLWFSWRSSFITLCTM